MADLSSKTKGSRSQAPSSDEDKQKSASIKNLSSWVRGETSDLNDGTQSQAAKHNIEAFPLRPMLGQQEDVQSASGPSELRNYANPQAVLAGAISPMKEMPQAHSMRSASAMEPLTEEALDRLGCGTDRQPAKSLGVWAAEIPSTSPSSPFSAPSSTMTGSSSKSSIVPGTSPAGSLSSSNDSFSV